jgi:hypothetical protein
LVPVATHEAATAKAEIIARVNCILKECFEE